METLDSAKAQTYQNIEIIISDDCSTDNTVEICKNWLNYNKDRFVRTELITMKKNTGISPNCNRAYNAANGEWIKGIAGDDILKPNCIEHYVEYVNEYPDRKFLFSKVEIFGNKKIDHHFTEDFWKKSYDIFETFTNARDQYEYLINKGNFVPATGLFINKISWINAGRFDEEILLCEDYPMWIQATAKGYSLTLLPDTLCYYRASDNSVQVSHRSFPLCGELLHLKYFCKIPSFWFSLIVSQIDQLDATKSKRNNFFLRILRVIAKFQRNEK
jgi:alpha-1,3-rhamnosyltransferase